jgi:hypothetical protein
VRLDTLQRGLDFVGLCRLVAEQSNFGIAEQTRHRVGAGFGAANRYMLIRTVCLAPLRADCGSYIFPSPLQLGFELSCQTERDHFCSVRK